MTEIVLFHHAQGLTAGVQAFANELRSAGHRVAAPDLYDGVTFDSLEAGVAQAEQIGFEEVIARGVAGAGDLDPGTVVIGFSLGALPAQQLAQTRSEVVGAVLLHGAVPSANFGGPWPAAVALQVHLGAADPWSELPEAEQLVAEAANGELFVYPGSGHLITDRSLGEYEPDSAELIGRRVHEFVERVSR